MGYNREQSRISAEAVFLIYAGQQLSSSFLFVHQIALKKQINKQTQVTDGMNTQTDVHSHVDFLSQVHDHISTKVQ